MGDRPSAVDKLPSRPLSVAEGQALADQESDSHWIRPESIIIRGDEQVVVALMAVNRDSGNAWLLGYTPDGERWDVVDTWRYDDLEHDAFYARLDEWEAETFAGRDEWTVG